MKLSLVWLSDHLINARGWILASHREVVARLISSTTEIEQVEEIAYQLDTWFAARVEKISRSELVVAIPEKTVSVALPVREDVHVGSWILVREEQGVFRYATYQDLFSSKEGLVPPCSIRPGEESGGWKNHCVAQDVRITIDNKAINHRPDLWSHRGLAREVAVLFQKELVPPNSAKATLDSSDFAKAMSDRPDLEIKLTEVAPAALQSCVETAACDRFATMTCTASGAVGSPPWMLFRLALMDSRSWGFVVDATNYVLFDIGQPLHAFDAETLQLPLVVRQARAGESLMLLDRTERKLTQADCVVADSSNRPRSLAGIMGGLTTGVTHGTKQIVLESAHFSPREIRHSATYHKIRTESSARFEKGVDVEMGVCGIQRFVQLLQDGGLLGDQTPTISRW